MRGGRNFYSQRPSQYRAAEIFCARTSQYRICLRRWSGFSGTRMSCDHAPAAVEAPRSCTCLFSKDLSFFSFYRISVFSFFPPLSARLEMLSLDLHHWKAISLPPLVLFFSFSFRSRSFFFLLWNHELDKGRSIKTRYDKCSYLAATGVCGHQRRYPGALAKNVRIPEASRGSKQSPRIFQKECFVMDRLQSVSARDTKASTAFPTEAHVAAHRRRFSRTRQS